MPTVNTSTIAASGGDYSSISSWEGATDNDLVTADDVEVGELTDTSYTSESINMRGGTYDSTRYRILRAGSSNEYEPIGDTGARITYSAANSLDIDTNNPHCRIESIGFIWTATTGNCRIRMEGADQTIHNIFVDATGASFTGSSFGLLVTGTGALALNVIVVGNGVSTETFSNGMTGSDASAFHCAVYDCNRGDGIQEFGDTAGAVTNCSVHSSANDDFGASLGTESYNASGDATAAGTGSLTSVSLANMFNDAASNDFRPGSSTEGAGTDLSADSLLGRFTPASHPAYSGNVYKSFEPGVYHDDNGASAVSIGPYLEVPSSGPTNYTIDGDFDILVPTTTVNYEIDGSFQILIEQEDTVDGDFMVLSTQPATVDGDFTVTSVQGATVDGDFEIVVESNAHTINGAFALRVVNSIGSGQDYANLPAWESATDFDLVTSRTIIEGELYDDASSGVVFTVTGATTDANYNRTLRPDAGSEYDPIADTGRSITMTNAAFPYVVGIDEDYFTLEHFEIVSASTASTSHGVRCLSGGSAEGVLVDSCVIRVPNITSGAGLANFTGDDMEFRNCLVPSSADAGIDNAGFGSTLTVNNCVVYAAAGAGIDASIGDITATNCHADSTGTALNLTSGTTCSASDTTGTAAELDSLVATDIFEDPANGDFRPQVSGALAGAGTDLSGTFTEDFANATHGAGGSPWNIGAYEETTGATSYDISGSFLILIPQGETVDGDFTVLSTQSGTVDGDFVVLMSQAVTVDGDFVIVVVGTSTVDGGFQVLSTQTQTVDGDFLISQGMTATLDGTFRIAGQADTMALEVSGNFMIFNLLTEFRNLERMVSILWRRKQ